MIVNTAQGGGGSLPLNLNIGPDEPAVKEGLWIKTPEKHAVKQITSKDSFVIGGTLRSTQDFAPNLNPTLVTHGYLIDDHYLYWITYENTSKNIYLAVARYDFITNTSTSKQIYPNISSIDNEFYGVRYSFIYKLNEKICFFIKGHFVQSNWNGFKGSFDPTVFDTLDHIGTSGDGTGITDFLDNQIIAKDNSCCILLRYFSGDPSYIWMRKFDYQTNTAVDFETASSSSGCPYQTAIGGIYDNIAYCYCVYANTFTASIPSLDRFDLLNNKALSSIHLISALNINANTNFNGMYSYQNKLIIPCATPAVVLDLTTLTQQIYSTNATCQYPCLVYQTMFLFYNSQSPNLYSIFDFQSESLDQNQLAILNGRDYSYKLISTAKLNYLRATLNSAWWYDTDFREYPTYIGDGTKFNKIKN